MAEGWFVSYLRVSTKRQGDSGLGLEAQRKAVTDYVNGGAWTVAGEFVEVESGISDANRPKLQRAIQACWIYGAKLLIAKLDRLSRDADFLLSLEKAGIEFMAADMHNANRLTVEIMAMVADEECRAISSRTKAALTADKAGAVELRGDRGAVLSTEAKAKGVAAVRARPEGQDIDLAPIILDLRSARLPTSDLWRQSETRLALLRLAAPSGPRWR